MFDLLACDTKAVVALKLAQRHHVRELIENSRPWLQVEPHFILKCPISIIIIIIFIKWNNNIFVRFQWLIKNMQMSMLFHVTAVAPFKLYWLGLSAINSAPPVFISENKTTVNEDLRWTAAQN